jgi:hypothetical protein
MTDASEEKFVLELVDDLIAHGVGAAQNGIIHSLAIWLDNNIQGEFADKRFQPKIWDESQNLPSCKNEWEASLEISSKILGRINGISFEQGLEFIALIYAAWMLSCPAFIIRNSPQYKGSTSTETETELIGLMFRYLDIYMTM